MGVGQSAVWGDQGRERPQLPWISVGRWGRSEVVHTVEGGSTTEVHSVRCSAGGDSLTATPPCLAAVTPTPVAGVPRVAGWGGVTVPWSEGIFGHSGQLEENHSDLN